MKAQEHRALGDAGTGDAEVNLGGDPPELPLTCSPPTGCSRWRPAPRLRRWMGRKACQAYQRGFVETLTTNPKEAVWACVGGLHPEEDIRVPTVEVRPSVNNRTRQ